MLLSNGVGTGQRRESTNGGGTGLATGGGGGGGPLLETTTVKKGLLWQQWDKFFSRWKERYFVLTKDYLACFKKESKVGTSAMGGFLYKVNLADVEGLQWADKKRTGVIALRVGTEGQLLLWTNCGLDDWMFALRDAIGRSKGRREALRKAHTLGPQFCDSGLTKRQALLLQHTLSDGPSPSSSVRTSTSCELRSLGQRTPTPSLTRQAQRMSVAENGPATSNGGSPALMAADYDTRSAPWSTPLGPRLAPQCAGSYSSLVSLGQRSHRPSPRSLQVSPALAQRSLYAQHVLSSPEAMLGQRVRGGATASATLEFSYIRPDSPVTSGGRGGRMVQSNTLDGSTPCQYQRSQSCNPFMQLGEQHKFLLQQHRRGEKRQKPTPFAFQELRGALPDGPTPPGGEDPRPSSIYGQPSLTVEKSAYSVQPPDVIPNHKQQASSRLGKRSVKAYTHSKSDSSFVLRANGGGHLAVT